MMRSGTEPSSAQFQAPSAGGASAGWATSQDSHPLHLQTTPFMGPRQEAAKKLMFKQRTAYSVFADEREFQQTNLTSRRIFE